MLFCSLSDGFGRDVWLSPSQQHGYQPRDHVGNVQKAGFSSKKTAGEIIGPSGDKEEWRSGGEQIGWLLSSVSNQSAPGPRVPSLCHLVSGPSHPSGFSGLCCGKKGLERVGLHIPGGEVGIWTLESQIGTSSVFSWLCLHSGCCVISSTRAVWPRCFSACMTSLWDSVFFIPSHPTHKLTLGI